MRVIALEEWRKDVDKNRTKDNGGNLLYYGIKRPITVIRSVPTVAFLAKTW